MPRGTEYSFSSPLSRGHVNLALALGHFTEADYAVDLD